MSKQTLNKGTAANDGTGDTLRVGAQKINENFTELYNVIGGSSLGSGITLDSSSKGIIFEGSSADSHETTLIPVNPTQDNNVYIPDDGGTLILDSCQQTLTNKVLTSPVLTTPQINDTSANHQYVVAVSELAADRNVTLPLLTGHDEFTFNAHTQTLTNKTLVDPIANNLKIGGVSGGSVLLDSNSNEHLTFATTTGAVNQVKFSNAATGNPPEIASEGETNVPLNLSGKGTGNVQVNTGVAFLSHEVSTSAACSLVKTTTIFNAGGTITPTLANGSVAGQTKIFTNKNSGNAILTPTSFAGGTSITLQANEGCVLVWDGTNWQVVANNGGAIA
jgi:hypothetical protein